MKLSKGAFAAIRAKTLARKERRAERVRENAEFSGEDVVVKRKLKKSPSLSRLKKLLWEQVSLLVRSWSPTCVVPGCFTPTYCAAHIVPSHEGAATRYFLPNLYPCCGPHNDAERHRRASWVKKHEDMFGAEFVNALYEFAKTTHPLKKWWVIEQTERIKRLRGLGELSQNRHKNVTCNP